MMQSNSDFIRQGYTAFGAGDLETLGSMMADDVIHVVPGNNRFSGEHKGRDTLLDLYSELFAVSGGTYRADVLSIEEQGVQQVVSAHHASAQREGKALDTTENLTFTIEDGLITRIESSFTPEDEAAEDAFWGSA